MARPKGHELVSAWVPSEVAQAFKAEARPRGGTSTELRRLIAEAVGGPLPAAPPGAGQGVQVGVRLKPAERRLLADAARDRGTSPATWLRSLALAHLAQRPQWNGAELEALREIFTELRRIGTNVNQIAQALNVAGPAGPGLAGQGAAVREAAELVRAEMRRVLALITGNFDYWGVPMDERPRPSAEAVPVADVEARAAKFRRRGRPRRRPPRFAEGEA